MQLQARLYSKMSISNHKFSRPIPSLHHSRLSLLPRLSLFPRHYSSLALSLVSYVRHNNTYTTKIQRKSLPKDQRELQGICMRYHRYLRNINGAVEGGRVPGVGLQMRFIHSFTSVCRMQGFLAVLRRLPFFSVVYFFLSPFSAKYSSISSHLI